MKILIKPILTEKATNSSERNNVYSFVVAKESNKVEIKKEIETIYGVSALKVRTMTHPTNRKKKHTKKGVVVAKKGLYKKAMVELAEGNNIDFYNNKL